MGREKGKRRAQTVGAEEGTGGKGRERNVISEMERQRQGKDRKGRGSWGGGGRYGSRRIFLLWVRVSPLWRRRLCLSGLTV